MWLFILKCFTSIDDDKITKRIWVLVFIVDHLWNITFNKYANNIIMHGLAWWVRCEYIKGIIYIENEYLYILLSNSETDTADKNLGNVSQHILLYTFFCKNLTQTFTYLLRNLSFFKDYIKIKRRNRYFQWLIYGPRNEYHI